MNVGVAALLAVLLPVLLALGIPVYLSLGVAALAAILVFDLTPLSALPQLLFGAIHSFTLLAIPLFILAGEVLTRSGLSERLVELADAILGRRRGGLGLVTVAASVLFAGMSGSGPADVAALGTILIAPLVASGYGRGFSAALVAAGGGIGIIVPPSIALILYGSIAEVSISGLFVGGVLPGLVVAGCLAAVVWWRAPAPDPNRPSPPFGRAFVRAAPGLLAPFIILGGIYGGLFSPTEAAAVAAVYALFLGVVVYRSIGLRDLPPLLVRAASLSSVVLLVVGTASIFAWVLTTQGLSRGIAEALQALVGESPGRCLLVLNLLLLVLGLFLDAVTIFLVVLPVIEPVVTHAGVDPLHFGIVMTVNLALGQITPPVGVNLMVAAALSELDLAKVARAALPLVAAEVVALTLISAFPTLSTWLPTLMASP